MSKSTSKQVRPFTKQVRPFIRRVRAQGIRQIARDHHVDPRTRIPLEYDRLRWRLRHGSRGSAAPVYVVGLQRSGTNMLVRALQNSLETQVYNENDRRAFRTFSLRDDAVIRDLVHRDHHRIVVFKPLKDSDRIVELLDDPAMPRTGRALWAYRGYEGRVRSALGQFTDNNLQVLRAVASGDLDGRWQVRGMPARSLAVVRSFDMHSMNPESAAALMWFLRNQLFFDLGLDRREDVMLVRYERLLSEPAATVRAVAAFASIGYDDRMVAHIERRQPAIRQPLDLDPGVRTLCDDLHARLCESAAEAD